MGKDIMIIDPLIIVSDMGDLIQRPPFKITTL